MGWKGREAWDRRWVGDEGGEERGREGRKGEGGRVGWSPPPL